MESGRILLFYKYVDLPYPKRILKWQEKICSELGLTGRIILAHEGINGIVGGTVESAERYRKIMLEHEFFGGIDFKESPGGSHCFPRMRIVVKDEIVHLGINSAEVSARDAGTHLSPEQAHKLMQENPDNLVILDGRNLYEARIGAFKNAITPEIATFREFPAYIDAHADQFKDKQVLMYCTGGIRCERASAYVKLKSQASEVFQITGGIQRYVESYPDGFFRGKNYVFDSRVAVKVTDDILGSCYICALPYDEYTNCLNASCNRQYLGCPECIERYSNTCSSSCAQLLTSGQVKPRPERKKVYTR